MREWGREFIDKRDWSEYNEQLVIRGEFYLDLSFRDEWSKELERLNSSKKGGQYKFPVSLMKWLVIWKKLLDYRGLEGVTRKLHQIGLIPEHPDYTTIWHRIHSARPGISIPGFNEADVATDGSGLKTRNAGEYRILKYGDKDATRRRHLVVVITADVKRKKLLSLDVRIEGKGYTETSIAMDHISSISQKGIKIKRFYGDGAFDQSILFEKLHSLGAKPIIKIRKNATDWYKGSKHRRREVREYKNMGYERWARENNYGMRWPGTEGIFSAVKRKFGRTFSRLTESLLADGYQRLWAYDEIREYGESAVKDG